MPRAPRCACGPSPPAFTRWRPWCECRAAFAAAPSCARMLPAAHLLLLPTSLPLPLQVVQECRRRRVTSILYQHPANIIPKLNQWGKMRQDPLLLCGRLLGHLLQQKRGVNWWKVLASGGGEEGLQRPGSWGPLQNAPFFLPSWPLPWAPPWAPPSWLLPSWAWLRR